MRARGRAKRENIIQEQWIQLSWSILSKRFMIGKEQIEPRCDEIGEILLTLFSCSAGSDDRCPT